MTSPVLRRVLFLAYLFPPTGGGGVQRSVKFVKYLLSAGWRPTVLTVKPISYYVYDPSMLNELPGEVRIERAGSLDPLRVSGIVLRDAKRAQGERRVQHPVFSSGSRLVRVYRWVRSMVMFPDGQAGWIPFAVLKGLRLIRRDKIEVIYSPAAPSSSAVAALLLSKFSGLPFVIDFRDGWLDDEYLVMPTRLHRAGQAMLERAVVTNAAQICVYGRWLGDRLSERYPEVAARITEIMNGYDPADLEGVTPAPRESGKLRIVYSGSLYPHHERVFGAFLQAMQALTEPERQSIEVLVAGQVFEGIEELIRRHAAESQVVLLGYLPHRDVLSILLSADASLLLVRAGDLASVTGKVFELLMVKRPVVALIEPAGEAARVLRTAGNDQFIVSPTDVAGAAAALRQLLRRPAFDLPAAAEQFSRVEQTRELATVLDKAASA